MPQTPKQDNLELDDEPITDGTWEDDQKRREYYYDDSHGYQTYVPESDAPETASNDAPDGLKNQTKPDVKD